MVRGELETLNNIFLQTLLQNDRVLLKTILQGFTRSRSPSHLKQLFKIKDELGGFTPLQYVCLQGNSVAASVLIDTGSVDVNEKGPHDWTSLHAAAYSGDCRTVQILLNSCSDCFARDENGNLPIDFANNLHIKDILQESMKKKNLEIFNELNNTYHYDTSERNYRRSNSCFPNNSYDRISNLKNKLHEDEFTTDVESDDQTQLASLKKWRTYTNLASEFIYNPLISL